MERGGINKLPLELLREILKHAYDALSPSQRNSDLGEGESYIHSNRFLLRVTRVNKVWHELAQELLWVTIDLDVSYPRNLKLRRFAQALSEQRGRWQTKKFILRNIRTERTTATNYLVLREKVHSLLRQLAPRLKELTLLGPIMSRNRWCRIDFSVFAKMTNLQSLCLRNVYLLSDRNTSATSPFTLRHLKIEMHGSKSFVNSEDTRVLAFLFSKSLRTLTITASNRHASEVTQGLDLTPHLSRVGRHLTELHLLGFKSLNQSHLLSHFVRQCISLKVLLLEVRNCVDQQWSGLMEVRECFTSLEALEHIYFRDPYNTPTARLFFFGLEEVMRRGVLPSLRSVTTNQWEAYRVVRGTLSHCNEAAGFLGEGRISWWSRSPLHLLKIMRDTKLEIWLEDW